jgi:hypothetical protein
MSSYEFGIPSPRQHAEQILAQSKDVLKAAVSIVMPESPDADPRLVFPPPHTVRAEDEGLPLSKEQTQQLLQNAAELGFGRAENVTLSEQGLTGATVVIEGGQPHKMMAEALLVMNDENAAPNMLIFAASDQRKIENEAEQKSAQHLFGKIGNTEYEVAKDVVRSLPGFKELKDYEEAVIHFSYDIENEFATGREDTGQFVFFGFVNKGLTPVILMRIDRKDYQENNVNKYRNQPQTTDIINIVDAFRETRGNRSAEPIALATSGIYWPSRVVGLARAGLNINRIVGLTAYGNDLVNLVRGTNSPPPINQLPGELYKMAQEVVRLDEALAAQQR